MSSSVQTGLVVPKTVAIAAATVGFWAEVKGVAVVNPMTRVSSLVLLKLVKVVVAVELAPKYSQKATRVYFSPEFLMLGNAATEKRVAAVMLWVLTVLKVVGS